MILNVVLFEFIFLAFVGLNSTANQNEENGMTTEQTSSSSTTCPAGG